LTQARVQMQLLVDAQIVLDQGEDLVGIKWRRLNEGSIVYKHEQAHDELAVHAVSHATVARQDTIEILKKNRVC
jgi:hypothetical protein